MMALAADPESKKVYAPEHIPYIPGEREPSKSYEQQLASKGLSTFVINGEKIIAHNEREAQKRDKARHKQ